MDATAMVELLSGITYRPGWTFTAEALPALRHVFGVEEDVRFRMACTTVDSDREYALKGYPETKTLEWDFILKSDDWQADNLIRQVFGMLMDIELHESREFFRLRTDDMQAPFHPHRPEGEAAWAGTGLSLYA